MTGTGRRMNRSRRYAVSVAAVIGAVLIGCSAVEPAGAAITTFTMAPESGPPGTVVRVRGRGCAPGLLGSADANFVTISVATFGVVLRAPVAADGQWSGSFTVPASGEHSFGSSTPVTAACVSTGVASLTTIYAPQSFAVTAASPPTTAPEVPPPTAPDAPPTTREPDRTVVIPDDAATVTSVPSPGGRDGASGVPAASRSAAGATTTSGRARAERAAEPATLRPAGFGAGSAAGTAGGGLGWLGWSLLLILLLGALAGSGYVWHLRRLSVPDPRATP
jgi:hypothetical protein